MTGHTIGSLRSGALADVDDKGAVAAAGLSLDWWVGADDRWHLPAHDNTTRQQRLGAAPVLETVVRVPGGDVVHRSYSAAATSGAVIVVEVENRSPVPLTVALVVQVARRAAIAVDGPVVRVDGKPVLVVSRPPGAWAAGSSTAECVTGGNARTGPVGPLEAPIELALCFPVPHHTRVRAAVGDGCDAGSSAPIDVRELPGPDAVVRGWERQLERGLQAHVPAPIGELVDAARADLLLASRHEPAVVSALEDWGFDDEAATGWAGLGWRARRRARQRTDDREPWISLRSTDGATDPVRFLHALRAVLVRDRRGAVELLPGFASEWLGQPVTVDALPLRAGPLSFAVRWHGARPALLWDAPPGVELCTPALDPTWSAEASSGDVLLAEPPTSLVPMGTHERSAGEAVDAPGQFS
ncbi:MAG: hypothetical protein ACLPVY_20830 [Acidimicrobiia bacterium]